MFSQPFSCLFELVAIQKKRPGIPVLCKQFKHENHRLWSGITDPMIRGEWQIVTKTAKQWGFVPSRGCPNVKVTCVRLGVDRFAAASLTSVVYSDIANPNPRYKSLNLTEGDRVVDLQWSRDGGCLLVATKRALFLIERDGEERPEKRIDSPYEIMNAFWLEGGEIMAIGASGEVTVYEEGSAIVTETLSERPLCAAFDEGVLYVGLSRTVEVYPVNGTVIQRTGSFDAHPREITSIHVMNDTMLVSAAGGAVLWRRGTLVPILSVKSEGKVIRGDPGGELAVAVGGVPSPVVIALRKGRPSETQETLKISGTGNKPGDFSADWGVSENGSKILVVANGGAVNGYSDITITTFTRR